MACPLGHFPLHLQANSPCLSSEKHSHVQQNLGKLQAMKEPLWLPILVIAVLCRFPFSGWQATHNHDNIIATCPCKGLLVPSPSSLSCAVHVLACLAVHGSARRLWRMEAAGRRRGVSKKRCFVKWSSLVGQEKKCQLIKSGTYRKKNHGEVSDSVQMPNCRLDVKKLLRTSVPKLQRPQFDALHRLVSTIGNHELAEKWQASEACPFRFLCLDSLTCVSKLAQKREHRYGKRDQT